MGGLALVSEGDLTGVNLGGLAVSAGHGDFWDFGPMRSRNERSTKATGFRLSTYRIQATELEGLAVAGIINRSERFTGLGLGAYNTVSGTQSGVTIGIFNHAETLKGVQIRLINYVPSNPPWLRWLPIFNAPF